MNQQEGQTVNTINNISKQEYRQDKKSGLCLQSIFKLQKTALELGTGSGMCASDKPALGALCARPPLIATKRSIMRDRSLTLYFLCYRIQEKYVSPTMDYSDFRPVQPIHTHVLVLHLCY